MDTADRGTEPRAATPRCSGRLEGGERQVLRSVAGRGR